MFSGRLFPILPRPIFNGPFRNRCKFNNTRLRQVSPVSSDVLALDLSEPFERIAIAIFSCHNYTSSHFNANPNCSIIPMIAA